MCIVSDKFLTNHCDILQNLLRGIMADRGFDIDESTALFCAKVLSCNMRNQYVNLCFEEIIPGTLERGSRATD